jgi:sugar (pentulose or hexulose) kinase
LKLGYEPESGAWSEAVSRAGIPPELLPHIYRPGEQVGTVSSAAALETNLPTGTPVLAGATDGIASLIASGASQPGDANTTLGTTIVWKALTTNRPPITGGIYCHLHPSGRWAPGAASNTGMGSLRVRQPGVSAAEMDHLAVAYLPSPIVCYLLAGRGERFPFINTQAETFLEGDAREPAEQHAAELQSIGFAERWGYEVLEGYSVKVGDKVFSTGAAAASGVLSQLRSNNLNRVVVRAQHGTAAFGAAILAASGTIHAGDVTGAIQAMTKVAESFEPVPAAAKRYDEIYRRFREACARRGYGA